MEYVSVAADFNGRYSKAKKPHCMVIKGVKQSMYDSKLLGAQMQSVDHYQEILENKWSTAIDYVQEGINLGRMLGKKLKTRDEDRSLKTTRMETGAIDRRLIAELGFGNDRVFNQVIHNTVTPSIVHISVDASGSMAGAKWEAAMKTAIAIAKAASMVSSLDCIISVRGIFGVYQSQTPLMWVIYDSRVTSFAIAQNHFKMIAPGGSTPEGLCYEAVMKDIIKSSNGKESFFINICDGEPGYEDRSILYGGEAAIDHTASQVKKMQAAGIKTLAYFVHGHMIYNTSKNAFRRMYGNSAEFIDVNNLTQLSQSLNKLFIRK
jgi:nitric oxide reductase activation protein